MAPPQGQMRPGRQLAVLGLIFAVLYLLVFFAGASGGWKERLEPKLGLDLIGGTRVTLEATTSDGQPPSEGNLEEARRIIEDRSTVTAWPRPRSWSRATGTSSSRCPVRTAT